ncbi:uncharacterized protein LOC141930862 [Strix aluco]|uniref:uncharacterized protein LOC141930862 n=1 Tax=Strix aluco TaxID=111821 RepID=UPI003DA1D274
MLKGNYEAPLFVYPGLGAFSAPEVNSTRGLESRGLRLSDSGGGLEESLARLLEGSRWPATRRVSDQPRQRAMPDIGGAGPAGSPWPGGRAPRDVAEPAAARRLRDRSRARRLPRGTRSHRTRQEGSCRLLSKLLINNHPGAGEIASTSTRGTAPGSRGRGGGSATRGPLRIFTGRYQNRGTANAAGATARRTPAAHRRPPAASPAFYS